MKKIILIIIIIISFFINTACWDKHEMENRAYITAIGMDKIEGDSDGFKVTYEYPNLRAVGKNGQGEPKFIISKSGKVLSKIDREIGTIVEKDVFFNHLRVIIIGEDLAKDKVKFSQMIEIFNRTPITGRKVIIFIAKGRAEDILNSNTVGNSLLGRYLSDLSERKTIGGKYRVTTISDLSKDLYRSNIGLVGKIKYEKNNMVVEGSSIIKDRKLVEFLDQKDTRTILILTEEIYNDEVTIMKDSGKYIVNYIVGEYKVEKDVKVENGNINFIYDIKTEGYIDEYLDPKTIKTDSDLLEGKIIKNIEKQLDEKIKKSIINTIDKLQNEVGVDVLKVEDHLRKKEPELWDRVKDNWENEFKEIDFTVNVNTEVRRIGLTK
ncbi:Ger(x)C family spore germination protein [Senegalia massiliensis]|uniref:Ger(X)C family spore germination protein n=1 Tax=Senegalia massiliensis TaxID=1720316 RepID=A0A845QUP6_9CLOT|nr:Ger(x)C family spore germination protein [Senegalia massiliensis]NBI06235.1 Ger(x)C family spore germination protein [Senegalia massiliensis]